MSEIRREYDVVLALDNVAGAGDLFGYRPPREGRIALFVGNERRGLPPGVLRAADKVLQLPMARPGAASLNVAGAAAAGAWQLFTTAAREDAGQERRPGLVFAHPGDPGELGSALRSAWALGWERAGLIDSHGVWFTGDRATFAAGRGAARRHKNRLKVYPVGAEQGTPDYDLGLVVTSRGPGEPLWRVLLPRGRRTVVFLPDDGAAASYERLAREVRFVSLGLPVGEFPYRLRLVATMVLAELARRCRSPPGRDGFQHEGTEVFTGVHRRDAETQSVTGYGFRAPVARYP